MLLRIGLLSLLLSSGPSWRCGSDVPPSIPPQPRFLDSGYTYDVQPPDLLAPDAGLPDQSSLPASDTWVETVGRACTPGGNECGQGRTCLFVTNKKVGVCAEKCSLNSPLIGPECPPNTKCGSAPGGGSSNTGWCYRICTVAPGQNSCPAGVACHFGYTVGLVARGACLGPPGCARDSDCPVRTSTACGASGGKPCPTGQFCHPVSSATGTAGHCASPGKCDIMSGHCMGHTLGKASAKVGDPCADDTACGAEMTCLMETTGTVTLHRNGYCTMAGCSHTAWTARKCPTGSACNRYYSGGRCQLTCDLKVAAQCRGQAKDLYGDYECRAWDMLSFGGYIKISDAPVCDSGPAMPCDLLASSKLDCSSVGLKNNPTNMSCRGLDGTKLARGSATGYCLDDTASGANKR